jgi:chromatin segregation and condensation protein Rec8/ScpA/Scc1 (kleisin family)
MTPITEVTIAEIPITDLLEETWEGILQRLTVDMDPWDIDIVKLARRYREYVDALRELHFEVSGRMVLTCSILLRMQSDDLLASQRPTDRNELIEDLEQAIEEEVDKREAPMEPDKFYLPLLRRPRRQVTIFDLKKALASAMKVSLRRVRRREEGIEEERDNLFDDFELGGENYTDKLHSLFGKIKDLLSGRRLISFFRLLDRGDKKERVTCFFQVLHLAAQGEIECRQEEFLGDITIMLAQE